MKYVALSAALAVSLLGSAAGAASLSLGGTGSNLVLAGNDLGLNGQTVTYFTGTEKDGTNGLSVSGPARVTYTYLGYEAGNDNYAANVGGTLFQNGVTAVGATQTVKQWMAGLINLSFGTSAPAGAVGMIANDGGAAPASADIAIGYIALSSTSYLVLFDDIASDDRDFDDIGVRIDVSPVPVPAAGLLLVGALGGLAAIRRRKPAA